MTTPPPTREQLAIYGAVANTSAHLVINAGAGTGKTSTLIGLLPKLTGSTLILAFNKSIATELATRIPRSLTAVRTSTVHSAGLAALRKQTGKRSEIVTSKTSKLISKTLSAGQLSRLTGENPKLNAKSILRQLISAAKSAGFGISEEAGNNPFAPLTFPSLTDLAAWETIASTQEIDTHFAAIDCKMPWEEFLTLAVKLLTASNIDTATVDFDDMIYLPLLSPAPLPTYSNVAIDEAQDISRTRRLFAYRSLVPTGRLIAVGDKHQAIYGFTGADHTSLASIATETAATELPLSTCWRCSATVITAAQEFAPSLRARPNAPAGSITTAGIDELLAATDGQPAIAIGDAIICRLNRPLAALALELTSRGLPARIEGRDIGRNLLKMLKESTTHIFRDRITKDNLLQTITNHVREKIELLKAADKFFSASLLADNLAALIAVGNSIPSTSNQPYHEIELTIQSLFVDDIPRSQFITLTSIHKAKGREWPRVFGLGCNEYLPHRLATSPDQLQQEENLHYVLLTRAQTDFIYVTGVNAWLEEKKAEAKENARHKN
jgi:superfamily I DNA/RNA helicase